ncbi:MAG: tRNA-dihydrouridine synthase, partial [Lachnospiraceae bacterium]|nr:tRNA-dihydrouridine synthase [Lachnospiraceae bacterium]
TVKIRKGYTRDSVNAVEIARIAEQCGASAIAVHGRTRDQFYAGSADWEISAAVKDAVDIPVIGSGDVTDGPSAKAMLVQTGCDGIMIGRAARGNPWIFDQIGHYLQTGETMEKPPLSQIRETVLRHTELMVHYKGEYTGIREMRKHVAWYTAGYPHSAGMRRRVNEIETVAQLKEMIMTLTDPQ